jgi:hypothetical protein
MPDEPDLKTLLRRAAERTADPLIAKWFARLAEGDRTASTDAPVPARRPAQRRRTASRAATVRAPIANTSTSLI